MHAGGPSFKITWSEPDCNPVKGASGGVDVSGGVVCENISWKCEITGTIKLPRRVPVQITVPFPNRRGWSPTENGRWMRWLGAVRNHERVHARTFGNIWEKIRKHHPRGISETGIGEAEYMEDAVKAAKDDAKKKLNTTLNRFRSQMLREDDTHARIGRFVLPWPKSD